MRPRDPVVVTLLWAHIVSLAGTQVSRVAIPVLAIQLLGAGPAEMGALRSVGALGLTLAFVVSGVVVDRLRPRHVMIAADLGQAALLCVIVALCVAGLLSFGWLLGVMFGLGIHSAFFHTAQFAYVPAVVERSELLHVNGRFEATRSIAEIAGPGISGLVLAAISPPFAIVVDAASFVVSAVLLRSIQSPDKLPDPPRPPARPRFLTTALAGFRTVRAQPILRSLAASATTWIFFESMLQAQLILYIERTLGLGLLALGIILAGEGIGALAGAASASRLVARFGLGRTLVTNALRGGAATLLIPFASGPAWLVIGTLVFAEVMRGFGRPVFNICSSAIQQVVVPPSLRARVNAAMRLRFSVAAIAGPIAGVGFDLPVRALVAIACAGLLVSVCWLLRAEIRSLRDVTSLEIYDPSKESTS
ncbi:MAG: MFS transporter [Kofleriaceae bacterium]